MLEVIKQRRSVRKYKPEQVTQEALETIIEAGRYAPSGGNNQYTKILVIQDSEVLQTLKQIVTKAFAKMEITEGMYKSTANSITKAKKGDYAFYYDAPTLIVTANRRDYGNALNDCACILENMMLEATHQGIGSCWINQLYWLKDEPEIIAYFKEYGISEEYQLCGSLAVGYSDGKERPALPRTGNSVTYIK